MAVSLERVVQHQLQRRLGFERYLFWFSRAKSRMLRWDRNERDILQLVAMVPADGVVLDIGANIGIMTVPLARRAHRGTVHAFEPIPENVSVLRRVVASERLSNVEIHPIALGDEDGHLQMVMPEQEHVRMQGLSHVATDDDEPGVRYEVAVRRLDDIEALADLNISAIKVDVENFEAQVFRGGAQLLKRCRPVVYTELWANDVREECFELFGQLGYSVAVSVDGRLETYDPERHRQHNFFFRP